jgi:hypothetical protein
MGAALKLTSKAEYQYFASEFQRRQDVYKKLKDEHFEKQFRYVDDKARLAAALCTRRAGKTGGNGRLMLLDAIRYPKSPVLYLLTTRDECKYVMWEPVIKPLNDEFQLGGVPNETELSMKFPNGSYIRCFGVDAKPDEMKKVLGVGYRLVVIDEAQKFRIDLRKLVFEMLLPAMADLQGKVRLTGTPDDLTSGLFYEVTRQEGKREPGWSVHEWNTFENPYMAKQWASDIAMLKETQPRIEETPSFQRMYLGKWVVDTSALVYKFDPSRNVVQSLPDARWTYVLGIDLGYDPDPSAFVICAYNIHQQCLYVVETFKQTKMIISAVAERVRYYQQKYNPSHMVIDGAAKQAVEELRQRFELPLISADKHGKSDFIEIMNSDLIQGRIKLIDSETKDLQEEWRSLIWDPMASKREEHPNCQNHLCFVAGTAIQTPDGARPIESLRVGDLVETRKGPRRVTHTMQRVAPVIALEMSDGSNIICTPDHPFWSEGQWVQAKELTKEHRLLSWSEVKKPSASGSTVSFTGATKGKNISVGKTLSLPLSVCCYTGLFGGTITALFQMGITFITKTVTQATIALKILSVCQLKSILQNIGMQILGAVGHHRTLSYCAESGPLLLHGTGHLRGLSGTEITAKKQSRTLLSRVHTAVSRTLSPTCKKTKAAVVQLSALQRSAGPAGLTTSNEIAQLVQESTKQTNTAGQTHVPVRVRNITATTAQTVFNITVEGEHEYFANGVLVSNCDAHLYAWRHCYQYLFKPDTSPKLSEHTHFIPENMVARTASSSVARAFTFRG